MPPSTGYLRALIEQTGHLALPLATPGPRPLLPLAQLYQPLALRRGAAPLSAQSEGAAGQSERVGGRAWYYNDLDDLHHGADSKVIRVDGGEAALARSAGRRMVVLGSPGAGKSTLLRALTLALARKAEADRDAPVPLLIDLPALSVEAGADMLERCAGLAGAGVGQGKAASWLLAALRGGRAVVCLDGLDEVAPSRREATLAWLRSLEGQPGAWVVGSRYTQYRSGDLGKGAFAEWELLPLDARARERLALGILAASGRDDTRAFFAALEGHPQADAWQGNPLLFTLVASQWARRGSLPGGRSALYQLVTEALLASRLASARERAALREAAARWGLELFSGGQAGLPDDELRGRVAAEFKESKQPDELFAAARSLLPGAGVGGHRTLLEYLAGLALAGELVGPEEQARRAWELAWSKRYFSRWTEPLRLMVGVLVHEEGEAGASKALAWVDALLRQRDTAEGDPGDLLVKLAIRSLGEISDAPSWPDAALPGVEAFVGRWADQALGDDMRAGHDAQRFAAELSRLQHASLTPAVERLRKALRGRDAEKRATAARALGWLGKRAPIEDLIKGVSDKAAGVQRACLEALSEVGADVPAAPVLAALESGDEHVRRAAAGLLGGMGDRAPVEQLVALLQGKKGEARKDAMKALAALGERAPLDALIKATRDTEWEIRHDAVEALGRQGKRTAGSKAALDAILKQLTGGDRYGMVAAAMRAMCALEQVPLDRWVPAALGVMRKPPRGVDHGSVCEAAVETLVSLGERAPVAELIELLSDPRAHEAAEKALISLAPWVPVQPLEKMLKAGPDQQRQSALRVLGHRGEQAPVKAMVAALKSKDAAVRLAAVRALGKLGDSSPIDAIEKATGDKDGGVRSEAYVALARNIARADAAKVIDGLARLDMFAMAYVFSALAEAGHRAPISLLVPMGKACQGAEGQDEAVTAEELMDAAARCFDDASLLAAMREPEAIQRSMAGYLLSRRIELKLNGDIAGELAAMASEPPPRAKGKGKRRSDEGDEGAPFELQPLDEVARGLLDALGVSAPAEHLTRRRSEADDEASSRSRLAALSLSVWSTPALAGQALALEIDPGDDPRHLIDALGVAARRVDLPRPLRQRATERLLALGQLKKGAALGEVASALGSEPLPAATQALLWKHVDKGAKNWHDHNNTAGAAIEALRRAGAQPRTKSLLAALGAGQQETALAARGWLASLGDAVPVGELTGLVEAMRGQDGYGKMYGAPRNSAQNAALVLGSLGARAPVELLIEALTWPCEDMRKAAIQGLSGLGERAPLAPLLKAASHKDVYVRETAYPALSGRTEPEALRLLVAGLAEERASLRGCASGALAEIGLRRPDLLPVEPLIGATRDGRDWLKSDFSVQRSQADAALALRGLGDAIPLDRLAHLEGHAPGTAALCTLAGCMKTRAPIDRLVDWLNSAHRDVKSAAALALLELGQPLSLLYEHAPRLDFEAATRVAQRLACDPSPASSQALHSLEERSHFDILRGLAAVADEHLARHTAWLLSRTQSDQPHTRARAIPLLARAAPAELERAAREALAPALGGQPAALADQLDALGSLPALGGGDWQLIERGLADPQVAAQLKAIRWVEREARPTEAARRGVWNLWTNGAPEVKKAAGEALSALLSREGPPEDG